MRLTRCVAVAAATVIAGTAAPTAAFAQTSTDRLFAPDGVWNAPLAPDAPLDPRTDDLMSAFRTQIKSEISRSVGPWIATTSYSTPILRVAAGETRVPVTLDTGSWGNTLRAQLATGVPIPAGAKPAAGTDGHLTVYQPSTDTLWEFWKAVKKADGWHASWGGVMHDASTSPGYYRDRRAADGTVIEQRNWGSTATSLPVAAGVVTVEETRRGRIDHALALNIPAPCADVHAFPAQREDGTSTAPDCMPEGARMRIDPAVDLDAIVMPKFTRMLAEAAQTYGIIVRDRTGVATGFACEDPAQFGSDLWGGTSGTDGLLGAKPWNLVRNQFPWGKLQLTRMDLD